MRLLNSSEILGSSMAVGSSKIRRRGLLISTATRHAFCFMPEENVPTFLLIPSSSPRRETRRAARSFPPGQKAENSSMFSARVYSPKSAGYSMSAPVSSRYPHPAAISRPNTATLPASGRQSPVRHLRREDFPAPFSPTRPTISPSCTAKDTPSRMRLPPMAFVSPSTRIASFMTAPQWKQARCLPRT